MGVNLKRKRGSSAMEVVMVMVALVLLINTNSCGASFVLKSNVSSYRQCISTGAMDGCLIADDLDLDLDFDFFMDTHVVRILATTHGGTGEGANDPILIVCYHGDGIQYNCDTKSKPSRHCGRYDRANCWKEVAPPSSDGNGR